MTDAAEGHDATPEYGEVDWSEMEFLANNNGSVEGAPEPAEGSVGITVLSPDMIARRLLWDVAPCELVSEVASYLALPPISEDVENKEHEESHKRLQEAGIIAPLILAFSVAATRAVVGTMIVGHGETEDAPVDGEVYDSAFTKLQPVAFQVTLAVIAEMMNIGMLHTPHFYVEEDIPGDEDGAV